MRHRYNGQIVSCGIDRGSDEIRRVDSIPVPFKSQNLGLYVDHSGSRVLRPNDISKKEVKEVFDLAEMVVGMVTGLIKASISDEQREMLVTEARKAAEQLKGLRKHVMDKEKGG